MYEWVMGVDEAWKKKVGGLEDSRRVNTKGYGP
jgi:hypothetical protein